LIEEWQPEPLVPDVDENHPVLQNMQKRLVEGQVAVCPVLYIETLFTSKPVAE